MRKVFLGFMALFLIFSLAAPSFGAVKKVAVKKTVVKKKVVEVKKPAAPKPAAPVAAPKPAPVVEKKGGVMVNGGYGGGAGIIGAGYGKWISETMGWSVDAGYGIGNGYSVMLAKVSGIYSFGKAFAGLGLAATSYSNKVTDIPGLSGTFDKGTRFGGELFLGYSFGSLVGKIGYNTGLAGGLTAGASYLF